MKLKYLLRNAEASSEVGGTAAVATPAASTTPTAARATSSSNAKPVAFRTPSKEDLSKSFDMSAGEESDILGGTAGSGSNANITQSKEQTALEAKTTPAAAEVKYVPAVEPAKKETPAAPAVKPASKKEEQTSILAPVLNKQKQVDTRDYTGFDENEKRILKAMSNEAFNYVAPILKQKKTFAEQQNTHFYQHPQGYVLTPEYQRLQAETSYAQQEANAWSEQLMLIKQGKEWTPLVGVDPKTGKFIYGEKRQPTLQDEEQVRLAMGKCVSAQQQSAAQLQNLPQQFAQRAAADMTAINQERAKRFDWVRDPELLKVELELDGIGKRSIAAIKQDFISLFPPYQQRTAGVEVASDLWVATIVYGMRLKEAEAGKVVAETLKEEATRVEPTASNRPKNPKEARFGTTEFSLDGLPS